MVEAFTDLKRHRIADPETPQLANEIVSQGFAATDEFVTKRLWEVGSSLGAFGHRGNPATAPLSNTTGLSQVIGRAVAAADRAERTADRIRSLWRRIAHERAKLGSDVAAADDKSRLPLLPADILQPLLDELAAAGGDGARRSQTEDALRRSHQALVAAHHMAQRALAQAAISSLDPIPITPTGYVPPETILSNVRRLREDGDMTRLHVELTVWCEDLAFRTEQIGQQVAVAALRMEAFATRGATAAATATAQEGSAR